MPVGNVKRPRRHWESLLWFGKHGRAYSDPYGAGEDWKVPSIGKTSHAAERNGWNHYNHYTNVDTLKKIARVPDIVSLAPSTVRGLDHPAPYPWQLAEWCGKLITPPGGTILDPFTGLSSTGVAAKRNGWDFIGIDSSAEYIEMSRQRLNSVE